MNYILIILSCFFIIVNSKTLIVTNNKECTLMTKDVLINGGSIIDASIRAILCEGIVNPQDTGIGGGFTGVFKIGRKSYMVNAREVSPFKLKSVKNIELKKYGSIGVPGMIKGFSMLHQKYGKMPWEDIFKPVISLCKKGVKWENNRFLLHLIFMNKMHKLLDRDNKLIINRPLCSTLENISLYGAEYFYNNISVNILDELKEKSFLDLKDFKKYKAKLLIPSIKHVNGIKMISTSYPGSGNELLNVIKSLLDNNQSLIYGINDFYKQNFQNRYNMYMKYNNEEHKKQTNNIKIHGTSNICIQENNNGLCFTSTINHYFGSAFYSNSTGIILNDQLHDIPSYYTNIHNPITPPTSSSTTLFFKKGKLFLLLGGTGGDRIPAGILNVINHIFKFKLTLADALRIQRIYYYDNMLEIEKCRIEWECLRSLSRRVISSLLKKADIHSLDYINAGSYSYNTVTGIYYNESEYDPRRGGYGLRF